MTATWLLLLPLGAGAGAVLGGAFFGGLWWTSRRLTTSANAGLVVATSYLSRMAVLAVCLTLLARAHPVLIAGALIGLIGARAGWVRLAVPPVGAPEGSPDG